MFEHNKTLGISYALKAGVPFSQSSTLCYEKLHSLTAKKLTFGINICYYFIGSFQNFLELILTHSLFKVFKLV